MTFPPAVSPAALSKASPDASGPTLGDSTPYRCLETMGEILQRLAIERPNRDALSWLGGRMNCAEFNSRTNAIAADLIKHGVKSGEIVGVSFNRSPEFVMLAAAIIKAGAAYMPIDESLPRERLGTLLEQALPWHVLAPLGTQLGWARQFCDVWEVDAAFFDRRLEKLSLPATTAETPACILFTSGSTGIPKGVVVVQRGILALVLGGSFSCFGANEVFLHHSSLSFDASTFEIWGGLLHGATLAIYSEAYPSIEKLQAVLVGCSVTSAIFTTSYFNVVVDAAPEILHGLRRLVIGGEAISVPHVIRALNLLPDTKLLNAYGPTECTVCSAVYEIPPGLAADVTEIPIGRMPRHWFGYVLNEHGVLVAEGETGELYVGGAGLAEGYLNQPLATAAAFSKHESLYGAPLLYKTGDLVRVGAGGNLFFCGRADNQIKLRGFRIELGEIERRLLTHPLVSQAMVLLTESEAGEKGLVSFIVSVGNVSADELRSLLSVSLPQAMIPGRFLFIDAIPLLPSGKSNKKALLALAHKMGTEALPLSSVRTPGANSTPATDFALSEWKRVQRPFPETESVPAVFKKVAGQNGSKIAIVDGSCRLTFTELDEVTDNLAEELRSLGFGSGATVGLLLPRSAEFVVGVLAVLKSGAAYVPLDPSAPPLRLGEVAADAKLGCVISLPGFPVPELGDALVHRLDLQELRSRPHAPPSAAASSGSSTAYVMYTSGSTGRPKGVVISHAGILRLSIGQVYQRCVQGLRASLGSSVTFDVSVSEIWPTLLNAGELHVYRDSVADIQALRDFLKSSQVEVFQITTALFHLVVDEDPLALSGPRLIVIAGEALSVSHCARLYSVLPEVTIVNAYGPTETTVYSHAFWVPRRISSSWSTVPIGYPIANTLSLVCDEQMAIVPQGTEGFLWLGGPGLASGYLNLPAITEEAFIPNPFLTKGASRLYRTGDRVILHPDGSLEFKGRHDNQIKLRGFRIELGEVERALTKLEGVARSAVLVRSSPSGQRKLVGYVVMQPGVRFSEADLIGSLSGCLASFMIPSHLVALDEFPLNSSGKVNRGALPQPLWSAEISSSGNQDDPVYEAVHTLWDEVLGGFRGDGTASFFDAGGDSLDASRVLVRLRQAYGVQVPLSRFVSHPTLGALVEEVRPRFVGKAHSTPSAWLPSRRYAPSSFQRRQIFEWSLDPQNTFGNLSHYVAFPGELDEVRLRSAFSQVLARHEILRTCYEISDEEIMGRVDSVMPMDFRCVQHADGVGDATILEILRTEAQEAYDLRIGPVARMSVHKVPGRQTWVHLMTHHIAFDGWSLPILLRDLQALYQGKDVADLGVVFPYSAYAAWEASHSGVSAEGIEYWKTALAGFNPLLPLRPLKANAQEQSICQTAVWPSSLVAAIRKAVESYQTNTLNLLSSALQIALGDWLRVEDFAIGTVMAVRPTVEAESTVGFFVNPLILRCKVNPTLRLKDFVAANHAVLFGALSHAEIPFEEVISQCGLRRPEGADRWFDVMLVLQSNASASWVEAGQSCAAVEIPPRDIPFSIVLSVTEVDDRIEVVSTLRTNRVTSLDHQALMDAWQSVLRVLVSGADRPLAEVASETCAFAASSQEVRIEGRTTQLGGVTGAYALQRHPGEFEVVVVADDRSDRALLLSRIRDLGVEEGCLIEPLVVPANQDSILAKLSRWDLIKLVQASCKHSEEPSLAVDLGQTKGLARKISILACGILARPEVGLEDDFFALGGSSLSGLRFVLKLGRELKVHFSLGDVLKLRTPLALASQWLSSSASDSRGSVAIQPVLADEGLVKLAPTQQRLWFLYRASPTTGAYHIPFLLSWRTSVDRASAIDAAQSAWNQILQRHESLRMRLTDWDGQGFQEPLPFVRVPVEVVECGDGLGAARKHLLALSEPPFDLLTQSPCRCVVYGMESGRFALGVVVHHLFFDGWSMAQLAEEFFQSLQVPDTRLPSPISYRQYARSQSEFRATPKFALELDFWKNRLKGFDTVLDLGTQRPVEGVASAAGAVCVRRVNAELLARIRARATTLGATLYVFLLSAAALVSARASGQRKFILGCVTAGRDSAGAEALVGFCVNTLPLPVEVRPQASASEFVSGVKAMLIESLADHHPTPTLDEIVAAVRPARERGIDPLVQVAVVLEDRPGFPKVFSGLELSAEILPSTFAPFEVTVQALLGGDDLEVVWSYRPSVYSSERVNELADAYLQALGDLLPVDSAPLSLGWAAATPSSLAVPAKPPAVAVAIPLAPGTDVAWLPIYQQLQDIWEQLLGVTCVGIRQDFFDLGGHSLLALRLIQKIHASFGVSLSIEALFEAPTILALAGLILRGTPVEHGKPFLLQAGTGAGQIIFFHGDLAGGGLYCRDLFKGILPDWEIWVIHPAPTSLLLSGVPQLADYHLSQISPILKSGPLVLGGFCLSGWIAYEVAARLAQSGHAVGRILLLDTLRPAFADRLSRHYLATLVRMGVVHESKALALFLRNHTLIDRAWSWWIRNRGNSFATWISLLNERCSGRKHTSDLESPPISSTGSDSDSLELEGAKAAASLLWGAASYMPKKVGVEVFLALSNEAGKWASDWSKAPELPRSSLLQGTHLGIITRSREPLRDWMSRILHSKQEDSLPLLPPSEQSIREKCLSSVKASDIVS